MFDFRSLCIFVTGGGKLRTGAAFMVTVHTMANHSAD